MRHDRSANAPGQVAGCVHEEERAEAWVHVVLHQSGRRSIERDRKSTRLNSSHDQISYAVFCLKKKKLSGLERSEFMPPVGVVEGYYTIHSELATMPKTIGKGVQEMDFIVAFPQAFRETIATLVRLGLASREETVVEGTKVRPYDVTSNVIDALPKPKEPELDVDIQRCVVVGEKDGHPATLRYEAVTWPHKKWNVGGGVVDTRGPP